MRECIERFLEYLESERGLTPNTVAAYRNDLSQLVAYLESPESGRWTLSSEEDVDGVDGQVASRDAVLGFFVHLREKGYAAATIARKVAAVKSLFSYLLSVGVVENDPVADLGSPEVKKPLPRAIAASEVEVLLERVRGKHGADGLRDRAMLELLYATGMRVSELVTLNLDDVDLGAATVRCVGRRGRTRVVPLPNWAQEAIGEYLLHGRSLLSRDASERALFLNQRGQRLTRQGFWLIMKALARDAGISSAVTPHLLRHTFAAHQLSDGLELHQLQQILGHANISTTQVYQQVKVPAPQREPIVASGPSAERRSVDD